MIRVRKSHSNAFHCLNCISILYMCVCTYTYVNSRLNFMVYAQIAREIICVCVDAILVFR